MDDKQFVDDLQRRFVDVKIPEALAPENMAAHLKKAPRITVTRGVRRWVAYAAIFLIMITSGVLIGPSLTDAPAGDYIDKSVSETPSIEAPSQNDDDALPGDDQAQPPDHNKPEQQNGADKEPGKPERNLTQPVIVAVVALILIIGIVVFLLVLPGKRERRGKQKK